MLGIGHGVQGGSEGFGREPLNKSLQRAWLSSPRFEPWGQGGEVGRRGCLKVTLGSMALAILGFLYPDVGDLCGLGRQEATHGWAKGGPLSSPEFRTVVSDMMEGSPCQGQSNLGLYVGLLCALSWSVLSYGRCCFLQLGRIRYVQIIRSAPRDRPLPLEGNERLVECSALGGWGGAVVAFWPVEPAVAFALSSFPTRLHPTPIT